MLHASPRAALAIPLPPDIPGITRGAIEAAIEAHHDAMQGLITLLDLFDGDENLEPSLGCMPPGESVALVDAEGSEDDEAEPDTDFEPSLGGLECVGYIPSDGIGGRWFDQRLWAEGDTTDEEEQCEDEGAFDDREQDSAPCSVSAA